MTFKVQLSDDKYLEIGVRETIDDEPDVVAIPIEELEESSEMEGDLEEEQTVSRRRRMARRSRRMARRSRRMARFLALGAFAGGILLLARSMRRRGDGDSMDVDFEDEEELAA